MERFLPGPEGSTLVELEGALAASDVDSVSLQSASLSCARNFDVSSRMAVGRGITSIFWITEVQQLGHIFCCAGERSMSIGMHVCRGEGGKGTGWVLSLRDHGKEGLTLKTITIKK